MRKRGNIPVIFATGMPTKTPLGNTVYCIVYRVISHIGQSHSGSLSLMRLYLHANKYLAKKTAHRHMYVCVSDCLYFNILEFAFISSIFTRHLLFILFNHTAKSFPIILDLFICILCSFLLHFSIFLCSGLQED